MAAPAHVTRGWLALEGRRLVEVTGADRVAYLHRMLTQDVAGLAVGRGAAACYLTPTGRVLAHLLLWHLEDGGRERLLLDVAPGGSPEALALLERYVIADDVTFEDVGARYARALLVTPDPGATCAQAGLALVGPAAGTDVPSFARGRIAPFEVPGARGWLLPLPFGARTAVHLLCPTADAEPLARALLRGAQAWGPRDLDRARVEEGVPAAGAEIDERILPNEARLDDAVAFSKGCYPGQEPVIMARHRGHPSTLLVRLTLEGAPGAGVGEALLDGTRAVGRLTTVVPGADGAGTALGFVRHALARPGVSLALEGGGSAHVA